MSKKVVSLLLTFCMILSLFSCITVSADEAGATPVITLTKENVSVTNVSGTYWLMLASYNDKGLVDAERIQINADYESSISDTGLNIEGATSMKAMIWESLENIKAVTGDKEFDMNAVYTVSFDANGGTGAAVEALTGKWGEKIVLPESELTKKGYTFAGWIHGSDLYLPGDEFTITADAEFTASWVADGEEFKVNFEETIYFATSSNGAETGTVKRNTTVQGNLFRNYATSAYYAKIDVDKYTDISAAYLNIYMTKFNNAATITVYDVAEEDYVAAFNGVENNAEFAVANLPGGEKITEKSYSTTSSGYFYAEPIDITDYITAKDAAGEKYAYIKLVNTAGGNATTDAARVYNFYGKAYVNVIGAVAPKATFAVNNEAGDEIAPVYGKTVILPECTYNNGDYDFIGWSDGVDVYQVGAEYVMPGDKEFTAVWGYVAYASFTTTDPGVVGTIDVINVEKGKTLALPTEGMSKPAKVGSYTLYGWNDGTATYASGSEYLMNDHANFTPVWEYTGVESATVEFDEKKLVTAGKWIPAYDETGEENGGAYDNTIQSVTNASGTAVSVNVRKTYGSKDGYRVRPFVYVSVDLVNEVPAESVVLNINAASSSGHVYIQKVDNIPAVGEENVSGTSLGNVSASDGATTLDITTAYNEAIGSTLYLKLYGWAWSDDRAQNYVTLDVDNLNITVSAKSNVEVAFDMGAETITAEKGTTITLPECTAEVEGKIFAGWTDGSENVYPAGSEYTVPVYNTTLKAVWAVGVTITFNDCEGIEAVKVAQGGSVTLPAAERTAKVGTYTHTGWTDGTETYAPGESYTATEDKALTAVWNYTGATASYAQSEYINYKDSATTATKSGSGTAKKNAVVSTNYSRPLPYYIYYKFDITNVKNVTSATFTLNKMQSKTGNITTYLYGIDEDDYLAFSEMIGSSMTVTEDQLPANNPAESLGTHTVTYRGSDSSSADYWQEPTFDITSYVNEQIAAGKDYVYVKFSAYRSGTHKGDQGVIYAPATFAITTGDAIPAYFSNGVDAVYGTTGSEITLPDCTELERGKVFKGWSDGTTTYEAGATYTLNAITYFTAVIENAYTIDLEGETYRDYMTTETTGTDTIVLPEIDDALEGYVHYGWTPDNGTTLYAAGSEYTVTADATLKAVYTKDLVFTDYVHQYQADASGSTAVSAEASKFANKANETLMLERAATKVYTTLDISGLDREFVKTTWHFKKQWTRTALGTLRAWPVTGDYSVPFGAIAEGSTAAAGTVTTDMMSALTLGSYVGSTSAAVDNWTVGTYYARELTFSGLGDYLKTQRESGAESVQLAFGYSGSANNQPKALYYTYSGENSVTIRVYTVAGAEAITPATPAE